MSEQLHIIIGDDHPLMRGALHDVLSEEFPACHFSLAENFGAVQQAVEGDGETDLVLLDYYIPGTDGFGGLCLLRAQYPTLPVAMISAARDPEIARRSLQFGASAFISKSATAGEIADAVRAVLSGQIWLSPSTAEEIARADGDNSDDVAQRLASLTPAQLRVLIRLRHGQLNKQIAHELEISEATVKAHVSAILSKLNVDSRTQAAILAAELDLGDPE